LCIFEILNVKKKRNRKSIFFLYLQVFLALSGIGIIGLSIGISYGLGSAFQLKYTDVHNVLPFLLLGKNYIKIYIN